MKRNKTSFPRIFSEKKNERKKSNKKFGSKTNFNLERVFLSSFLERIINMPFIAKTSQLHNNRQH